MAQDKANFLKETFERAWPSILNSCYKFGSKNPREDAEDLHNDLYIKYLDINSNIKGPFEIELDMYDELLKNDKRYLKNHVEWAWYKWELPYKMWSLNQLFEYRCALKSVSFKMDNKKEFFYFCETNIIQV